MICSISGCRQEVMPKAKKNWPSRGYVYKGLDGNLHRHHFFETCYPEVLLCYYHEKKAQGRFDTSQDVFRHNSSFYKLKKLFTK